jgi:hypothetical protein
MNEIGSSAIKQSPDRHLPDGPFVPWHAERRP